MALVGEELRQLEMGDGVGRDEIFETEDIPQHVFTDDEARLA